MATSAVIHKVPIKGYHVYKVKVPVGGKITMEKDQTVPEYQKILVRSSGRIIGSVSVPLNAALFQNWEAITVTGIIDGEPRFGGSHRYQRGAAGRPGVAGGGAFHTATLTVVGDAVTVGAVTEVAKSMGLWE